MCLIHDPQPLRLRASAAATIPSSPDPAHTPLPRITPACLWPWPASHRVHEIQGEDLDAADDSREGADDGGTNGEPADAEQQVLKAREKEGCERGLGRGNPTSSGPVRTPEGEAKVKTREMVGGKGMAEAGSARSP